MERCGTMADGVMAPMDRDVLEFDDALKRLEALDPRAAAVAELRFFAGLKKTEIAEVLGISLATLHRDWRMARAWLISRNSRRREADTSRRSASGLPAPSGDSFHCPRGVCWLGASAGTDRARESVRHRKSR
jgi:hypothetical protein